MNSIAPKTAFAHWAMLPDPSDLHSEQEIVAVRGWVQQKLRAGDHLGLYKFRLAKRLRALRSAPHGPRPTYERFRELVDSAGSVCAACGRNMERWVSGRFPTIDHIVPVARGGSHDPSNLRVICNACNSRKGAR